MTLTSSEGSDRAGVAGAGCWPTESSGGGGSTDEEGLMLGVLAALRSSTLSADEQQRRLNAMIVELQQLRHNLETSPVSSSASVLTPHHGYRNQQVNMLNNSPNYHSRT